MSNRNLEKLRQLPGVIRFEMNFEEGDILPESIDSDSIVGTVDLLEADMNLLNKTVRTIRYWEANHYFIEPS